MIERRQFLGLLAAPLLATPSLGQASQKRVGFIRHYAPYSFTRAGGVPVGFDVEVNERICQILGWQMTAVSANPGALRSDLAASSLDWIGNQLLITTENRKHFDFVSPHYASIQLNCIQHEDDSRDFFSLDDFVGKRLGVLEGSGVQEQARGALGKAAVGFADMEQAFKALARKELDAVLEESLIAEYFIHKHQLPIKVGAPFAAPMMVGLPVRKGDQQTREQLSLAVKTMLRDGSFQEISKRWFGFDVSKRRVS